MPQQTVGTTAVLLGEQNTLGKDMIHSDTNSPSMSFHYFEEVVPGVSRPILQNLGPGNLFYDFDSEVSSTTGTQLAVDETIEFEDTVRFPLYVIADAADTDVRYVDVG